jgi:hypothetical protein
MNLTAKILKRAIRKLKHGVAESVFLDDEGKYCMVGAIYSAAGCPDNLLRRAYPIESKSRTKYYTNQTFGFVSEYPEITSYSLEKALRTVERVVRRAEFGGEYDAYRGIGSSHGIAVFSDDHPDLVIPVMKQALREVR